ncbi:MAG: hypothetical protein U0800_25785 [Isosphaeraceae bacterium]
MTTPRPRGSSLMLLGPALAALGIAAYAVQLAFHRLAVPWYMPSLAFLGAILAGASLRERRSAWRILSLVVLSALGGFQVLALQAMRLPSYSGPIAVGKPFPAFEARLADGSPFTQAGLIGDRDTAMVFFRGRW